MTQELAEEIKRMGESFGVVVLIYQEGRECAVAYRDTKTTDPVRAWRDLQAIELTEMCA